MVQNLTLSITIPSTTFRNHNYKKVVFYQIVIQYVANNGTMTAWQVFARYSEFAELFDILNPMCPELEEFDFPRKRVLNGDQSVEERREKFEEFIRIAIVKLRPLPVELFLFLELAQNTNLNRAIQGPDDLNRTHSLNAGMAGYEDHVYLNGPANTRTEIGGTQGGDDDSDHPRPGTMRRRRFNSDPKRPVQTSEPHGLGGAAIEPLAKTGSSTQRPGLVRSDSNIVNLLSLRDMDFLYGGWKYMCCVTLLQLLRSTYLAVTGAVSVTGAARAVAGYFHGLIATATHTVQVLLVLLLLWLAAHRIIGRVLTWYLAGVLKQPDQSFWLTFGWVSLRLGFDVSEIIVHDFYWENPDQFRQTPYFLHLESLIVKFRLFSVVRALWLGQDIPVIALEFNRLTGYIEKYRKELNLWSCLGAGGASKADKNIKTGLISSALSAVEANQSQTGDSGHAVESHGVKDALIKYNPVSLLVNFMRSLLSSIASEKEEEASPKKTGGAESSSPPAPAEYPPHWGIPLRFSVGRITIRKLQLYAQDFLQASHSSGAASTALKVRVMDMSARELRDEDRLASWKHRRAKRKSGHGHVEDCGELEEVFHLSMSLPGDQCYRQEHYVNMFKLDAVREDGLFLDDLTWRLVGKLITELLTANFASLSTILLSAGINNVADTAVNTVVSAGKGTLKLMSNYNPLAVANVGLDKVKKMVIHANQDTSNIHQCPELELLGVTGVKLRIVSGRNVKYMGELVDSVFMMLQYSNQPERVDDKASKYKTSIRNYEGDDEENSIEWDEECELGIFYTLETELYVRMFEYKIARKDLFIAEACVPLGDLLNTILEKKELEDRAVRQSQGLSEAPPDLMADIRSVEVVEWVKLVPRGRLAGTGGEVLLGVSFF